MTPTAFLGGHQMSNEIKFPLTLILHQNMSVYIKGNFSSRFYKCFFVIQVRPCRRCKALRQFCEKQSSWCSEARNALGLCLLFLPTLCRIRNWCYETPLSLLWFHQIHPCVYLAFMCSSISSCRSRLHKSGNFCQKTLFKVHGRSSERISANSRITVKNALLMNGRIRNQGSLEASYFLQSFHHLFHILTLSAFG